MPIDPDLKHGASSQHAASSGPSIQVIQARARTELKARLDQINSRHTRYDAELASLSLGLSSGEVRIVITGPGIWRDVKGSASELEDRVAETLAAKHGGRFEVRVTEGSIEIAVIWAAIETAQHVYDLISSFGTIVEYIMRCVEQDRVDWPPIASMFTFFEALRRLITGF